MENHNKLQAPFERLKIYHTPDVALRIAIILQAYQDAVSTAKNRHARYARNAAIRWIFECTEDFQQICIEADIDPQIVIKHTQEKLLQQEANKVSVQKPATPVNMCRKIAQKRAIDICKPEAVVARYKTTSQKNLKKRIA